MKIFIASFLFSALAFAHSGGTNSSGCHNDHKNGGYHCHKSDDFKTESKRNPASADQKREPAQYHTVKGYVKSNGTYVAPHIRSNPNGTTFDNLKPRK